MRAMPSGHFHPLPSTGQSNCPPPDARGRIGHWRRCGWQTRLLTGGKLCGPRHSRSTSRHHVLTGWRGDATNWSRLRAQSLGFHRRPIAPPSRSLRQGRSAATDAPSVEPVRPDAEGRVLRARGRAPAAAPSCRVWTSSQLTPEATARAGHHHALPTEVEDTHAANRSRSQGRRCSLQRRARPSPSASPSAPTL